MPRIAVRAARRGDGPALAGIHRDMAAYYVALAPHHFQMPKLDGLAEMLDTEAETSDETTLHLVAELEGA